jgi:hypothetical protein
MTSSNGVWSYAIGSEAVTPQIPGTYGWINQGNATLESVGPYAYMKQPALANADSHALYVEPIPALGSAYDRKYCLGMDFANIAYLQGGLALYDSGSGKGIIFYIVGQTPAPPTDEQTAIAPEMQVAKLNSLTSFEGSYFTVGAPIRGDRIWMWIHDDNVVGGNLTFYYGATSQQWQQAIVVGRSGWMNPTHIGVGLDGQNANGNEYGLSAGMYIYSISD